MTVATPMTFWVPSSQTCYNCDSFSYKCLILPLNPTQYFPSMICCNTEVSIKHTQSNPLRQLKEGLSSLISSCFLLLKLKNYSLSSLFLQYNHDYSWMHGLHHPSLVLHFICTFSSLNKLKKKNKTRKKEQRGKMPASQGPFSTASVGGVTCSAQSGFIPILPFPTELGYAILARWMT